MTTESSPKISISLPRKLLQLIDQNLSVSESRSGYFQILATNDLKARGKIDQDHDLREELIASLPENEAHLRKLIECNAALIREETLAATEPATA